MEFEKWVNGFKTIYEHTLVGKEKKMKFIKESDIAYIAESLTGQTHLLKKDDMKQIETFINDKGVKLLFGAEKQTGGHIHLLMDFQNQEDTYRAAIIYEIETQVIHLHAWAQEKFPYAIEIAKEMCHILLKKESIRNLYQQGLVTFCFHGLATEENCKTLIKNNA